MFLVSSVLFSIISEIENSGKPLLLETYEMIKNILLGTLRSKSGGERKKLFRHSVLENTFQFRISSLSIINLTEALINDVKSCLLTLAYANSNLRNQ